MGHPEEELALWRRLVDAERAAQEQFYAYFQPILLRELDWLPNQGLSPDEMKDICHTAVDEKLQAMIHNPTGYDPTRGLSLRSFLKLIVVNHARDLQRQVLRRRRQIVELPDMDEDAFNALELSLSSLDSERPVEDEVLRAEEEHLLRNAIQLLQSPSQIIAVTMYLTGVPRDQIAAALGVSTDAVDGLLRRARRDLKRALEP